MISDTKGYKEVWCAGIAPIRYRPHRQLAGRHPRHCRPSPVPADANARRLYDVGGDDQLRHSGLDHRP